MFRPSATSLYDSPTVPFIMEGLVVATDDPDQMGRVRVWVPALDGETYDISQLPWADYVSPFMGFTVEYPAGQDTSDKENLSHAAYGFWAIPKLSSSVMVFCLNGDPSSRCYFAAISRLHRNRSLPAGRNTDFNGEHGPFGDAGDGSGSLVPIEPAYTNLRLQFNDNITASEARTRGAFERTVAQAADNPNGIDGYHPNAADASYLDCQTYCWITPGRHGVIMQDHPSNSRLRLKTAEGHQIIFDDANERIYLSTSQGNNWVELDQDGHIHIYANDSISVHTDKDFNLYADRDIIMRAGRSIHMAAEEADVRISAEKDIHIKANATIRQSACGIFDISTEASLKITAATNIDYNAGAAMKVSAAATMDLKAGGKFMAQGGTMGLNGGGSLKATAGRIDLNGPDAGTAAIAEIASCPLLANDVDIMPQFEPWERPKSSASRNKNWNP